MSWWGPLALAYGISFFAGIGADADGDMPFGEWLGFAFALGTLMAVAMYLAWWLT